MPPVTHPVLADDPTPVAAATGKTCDPRWDGNHNGVSTPFHSMGQNPRTDLRSIAPLRQEN